MSLIRKKVNTKKKIRKISTQNELNQKFEIEINIDEFEYNKIDYYLNLINSNKELDFEEIIPYFLKYISCKEIAIEYKNFIVKNHSFLIKLGKYLYNNNSNKILVFKFLVNVTFNYDDLDDKYILFFEEALSLYNSYDGVLDFNLEYYILSFIYNMIYINNELLEKLNDFDNMFIFKFIDINKNSINNKIIEIKICILLLYKVNNEYKNNTEFFLECFYYISNLYLELKGFNSDYYYLDALYKFYDIIDNKELKIKLLKKLMSKLFWIKINEVIIKSLKIIIIYLKEEIYQKIIFSDINFKENIINEIMIIYNSDKSIFSYYYYKIYCIIQFEIKDLEFFEISFRLFNIIEHFNYKFQILIIQETLSLILKLMDINSLQLKFLILKFNEYINILEIKDLYFDTKINQIINHYDEKIDFYNINI